MKKKQKKLDPPLFSGSCSPDYVTYLSQWVLQSHNSDSLYLIAQWMNDLSILKPREKGVANWGVSFRKLLGQVFPKDERDFVKLASYT